MLPAGNQLRAGYQPATIVACDAALMHQRAAFLAAEETGDLSKAALALRELDRLLDLRLRMPHDRA